MYSSVASSGLYSQRKNRPGRGRGCQSPGKSTEVGVPDPKKRHGGATPKVKRRCVSPPVKLDSWARGQSWAATRGCRLQAEMGLNEKLPLQGAAAETPAFWGLGFRV